MSRSASVDFVSWRVSLTGAGVNRGYSIWRRSNLLLGSRKVPDLWHRIPMSAKIEDVCCGGTVPVVSVLKGYSTPTTKKSDLCDDYTTQRRSLSFEHQSLAQKRLHFSFPASNGTGEPVTLTAVLDERLYRKRAPAKCGRCFMANMWHDGLCSRFFPSPPSATLPT
jgi:hypothetical protein